MGETDKLEFKLEFMLEMEDDDEDEVFFLRGPLATLGGFNCVFLNPNCE